MASDVALCMIVKDEPAERLAMLVEYVKPVVSHVVIADTGSKKNETELYRTWGVDAYDYDWRDDFSAARNSTLDRLGESVEWVLHLDADELPSWEMMKHLMWIKESGPKHVKGYQVFTTNFWGGERGIEVPAHWHVRLFRRKHGRWYKKVHEQVMIDGKMEHQAGRALEKMAKQAYLIHSKPAERLDESAKLYSKIGEK